MAEAELRRLEVDAVTSAPITEGLLDALAALHASGHTTTVVSNNSQAAVDTFIAAHDLSHLIDGVVARTEADPALLKPDPHLVTQAIRVNQVPASECVLIGDSTTDVIAAHRAGTAAIAYANKPGKRALLAAHDPDVLIEHLSEVTGAVSIRAAG